MWISLLTVLFVSDALAAAPASGLQEGGPAQTHGEVQRDGLLVREPMVPAESDDQVARWKKERFNAALLEVQSRHALWRGGKAGFGEVQASAERLLKAELAVRPEQAERVKVLRLHLAIAELWLETQARACDEGMVSICDRELAQYWQLEIKLALAELQRPAR